MRPPRREGMTGSRARPCRHPIKGWRTTLTTASPANHPIPAATASRRRVGHPCPGTPNTPTNKALTHAAPSGMTVAPPAPRSGAGAPGCPAPPAGSSQPPPHRLRRFDPQPAAHRDPFSCRPARPVVQILGIRYLAARPLEDIRCAPGPTAEAPPTTLDHCSSTSNPRARAERSPSVLPAGVRSSATEVAGERVPYPGSATPRGRCLTSGQAAGGGAVADADLPGGRKSTCQR